MTREPSKVGKSDVFAWTIGAAGAPIIDDAKDKVNYGVFKPMLLEMPHYTYLKTGDVAAKCLSFYKEAK